MDVDASAWKLEAEDAAGLRDELHRILASYPSMRVANLYTLMALDGSGVVSRSEFPEALSRIGYKGKEPEKRAFFEQVFRDIDKDGSGSFGLHDLQLWMSGAEGKREKARASSR